MKKWVFEVENGDFIEVTEVPRDLEFKIKELAKGVWNAIENKEKVYIRKINSRELGAIEQPLDTP